jgi:hypothetical protein
VLAGSGPRTSDLGPRPEASEGRRRRRDRRSGELPQVASAPSASAQVASAPATPETSVPIAVFRAHDEITAPAAYPFVPQPAPVVPVQPAPPIVPAEAAQAAEARSAEPTRRKSASTLPPLDELDTAWDLPEVDPTATKDDAPPSASEMAGDGATGGDGIDEPGWD